jgi:hypothetical protein
MGRLYSESNKVEFLFFEESGASCPGESWTSTKQAKVSQLLAIEKKDVNTVDYLS